MTNQTRAVVFLLFILTASELRADPIVAFDSFNILFNASTNSIGIPFGPSLFVGAQVQTTPLTTIEASATTLSPIDGTPYNALPSYTGGPDFQTQWQFFNPQTFLTNSWQLSFTDIGAQGTNSTITNTPSASGFTLTPLASQITVSGSSANPTFTWSFPQAVDGTVIEIRDDQQNVVVLDSLVSGTNGGTFTVPSALDGGLDLVLGNQYTLEIEGFTARPGDSISDGNPGIASVSDALINFTPLPTGSPMTYLPNPSPDPTAPYSYAIPVSVGDTYYLDPPVVDGYQFSTGAGDPNFASVLLPAIQSGFFDVSFVENGQTVQDSVTPGVVFDFPTGGVNTFTVSGIDPADDLDPTDQTAFDTGLTFVGSGMFTGTQTPIVTPEPATLPLAAAALIAICAARIRRRNRFGALSRSSSRNRLLTRAAR